MTLPLPLWAMMRLGFLRDINALVTITLDVSTALSVAIAEQLQRKSARNGAAS